MALLSNKPYREKLKDPRWQKRRIQILQLFKEKCALCDGTTQLEVHHGYYAPGRDPWDYPDHVLWCLCRSCHEKTQAKMTAIHCLIGEIHPKELDALKAKVSDATFEVNFSITREEAEDILAEERRAESVLYKDYTIELLFSSELGPSRVDEVEKLAGDRFPGIRIDTLENISARDCVGTVSGPDAELRGMIQSWLDRFAN